MGAGKRNMAVQEGVLQYCRKVLAIQETTVPSAVKQQVYTAYY